MKKILFASATSLLCFLISCSDSGSSSSGNSAGDKAKANNRAVIKAIEDGDVSKLDQYIDKDGVDHSGANGMSEIKGIDSIKKDLGSIKQDFSDFKIDIIQEAVGGNYLFVYGKMKGTTSANPGHGMPPNKKLEITSVDVLKFNEEGKFTDHWTFNDPREMMMMMGGMQPPMDKMENKMAPDTTKKM